MDLSSLSIDDLKAELDRRAKLDEVKINEPVLVVGSICTEGHVDYIEVFRKVKSPADMPDINSMSLRARFNTHRNYRLFYFKTDEAEYDKLNENLEFDNSALAEWLLENTTVTIERL